MENRMRTLFVATAGLETAPLANGVVVYNLKTSKFIMLNRSANRVWSALGKPLSEQGLVDMLRQAYPEVDAPAAHQAVNETLTELQRHELIVSRVDGEGAAAAGPNGGAGSAADVKDDYAPPSVKVLDEDDLLKVFQMTAAEISVAQCWWGACTKGCP
jgi:hypothetical protein